MYFSKNLKAGLAAVSVAGASLLGAGVAAAQSSSPTSTTVATPAAAARPDHAAKIKSALAPLVTNGTITQTQADAVATALATADSGRGGHGGGRGGFGNHGAVLAAALGMSTTDLATALQSGKSIAAIATERGVDINKVKAALVADEAKEHPEAAAADIEARVTAMLNGTRGDRKGGRMGGRMGGHGRGSNHAGAASGSASAAPAAVTA